MPFHNLWPEKDYRLTGKTRLRPGFERSGLFSTRPVLILQLEETYTSYNALDRSQHTGGHLRWRDATWADLPTPAAPCEEKIIEDRVAPVPPDRDAWR